ncbi:MAG: TolB family protein, partial [Steroidobacteraceae bacterium]
MKTRIVVSFFTLCVVLAGCGSGSKEAQAPAADEAAKAPAKYGAEAFFATTSYSLSPGYAWSSDDKQLLINSDETGIFNVYSLPAGGENKQPLTTSTTDSSFAVSWFPADGRVLYAADQGGNELTHLYVRETSGESRDLTPGDNTKASFFG